MTPLKKTGRQTMAGYCGYSMSNNAIDAYNRGLCPASKIKEIPAKLVRKFATPDEWHHTSGRYNRTDFFNPTEVYAIFGLEAHEDFDQDPKAIAALAAWRSAQKNASSIVYENCDVRWIEWSGSRNFRKSQAMSLSGCRVEVKGHTATITHPTFGTFKKRLETHGFSLEKK